jgi:hypothetical protein
VVVTFSNGTTRQRALFNQTIARSLFPWDRITTHVTVVFSASVPGGHHRFAATEWGSAHGLPALDSCGRPDAARITILDDLDDPSRPGDDDGWPLGHWRGEDFFMETAHHELGHVVQSKFSTPQINEMSAVFDGKPSDWDKPPPWEQKRQESFAEAFKDVWLPRPNRKFDNRAAHALRRDRFERFLAVLDAICPCVHVLSGPGGDGGPDV